MKKVAFYTDTPIYGGAERHMFLLAQNLDPDKFRIALICSKYKQLDEWCKNFNNAGINVARLKVVHKHDPRHKSQLKKILKNDPPDILHLHLWNPGSCRYAFSSFDPKITRLITTEHDPFQLKGVKNTFKKACLKKTDHTIAVSNANKELILSLYPELKEKITTIHNGIDIDAFEKQILNFSTQNRNTIKKDLFKADPKDFIILSIAALHPRKGLLYLIDSYKEVRKKFPKSKLVIVGEGPEKKSLEKLIKKLELDNHVLLLGQQENIPQILKSSDLFVLPSITEAFGLVLLEAMAASKPIIASQTGGIPEIVENRKSGILVEPKNSEKLAEAICDLMRNEALQQKLAFVGNHRVKEFDSKIMAKKTADLYNKILSQ